jgi:release factor glutamine methyltransferase
MAAEPWTIRRLLTWTEGFLREKAIDGPRLDTKILLAHALKCKRIDLYVRSDEEPVEAVRTAFKELIRRRVEGCPVAYLVGQREFYQLTLEVSPAVLIPRPETELLVMEALRILKGKDSPSVLDIGTGSGCIALAIARHQATAQLTATDISGEALALARKNAEILGLSARIRFVQGDLFEPVRELKFDLIASNPPYVSADELPRLMKEVRDFEPRLALDGGPDGLEFYRRLIDETPTHLNSGGRLLLEIGATQEEAVREMLVTNGSFEAISTHRDGQKLPRVIAAKRR